MSDTTSNETFTVDEITIINESVPIGDYKARLLDATGEASKASGKPTVYAQWEIVRGEHEGKETRSFYSLSVTRKTNKRGVMQTYAGGIAEYTAAMKSVGIDRKVNWPMNPTVEFAQQAAVAFKKAFMGKIVDLKVTPNNYTNSAGEAVNGTRVKVLGAASPVGAASVNTGSGASDPFADL